MAADSELEPRIDELYALPLGRFTAERDVLAKELTSGGEHDRAARVKALRKPVVAAWALNVLAREDAGAVGELIDLGERLRAAHRRAVSDADAEPFREISEERRRLVTALTKRALAIAKRGGGSASQGDDIAGTLEAATVDEGTAELLRAGRLTKPIRPPATFGGAGLRVLEGRPSRGVEREPEKERPHEPDRSTLRKELAAAESRERRAAAAVQRERERIQELDRRRSEARDRLRTAEAELRGASLERKRAASTLAKAEGRS